MAKRGHESKHKEHLLHFSSSNSNLHSSFNTKASTGHKETHAPQSIHKSKSTEILISVLTSDISKSNPPML